MLGRLRGPPGVTRRRTERAWPAARSKMRGLLSLEQELRAARRVKGQKKANRSDHVHDSGETERPWQPDIDLVQQTMRELLRVIASLSGVELPALPPGLQDDETPLPRLDIKTLKDRLRNDLEGFSIKTSEELAKRAKEQTHAALDAIQNEVSGRINQVAGDFRKQLQLPEQIEKLLETSVEETAAGLERSLSQKVEQMFAERGQLARGALSTVQAQINTVEETAARLERSLSQKVEQMFAEREQRAQERLQGAISTVQAQITTLEQTVQQIRELKANSVAQLSAERPNAVADNVLKKYENSQNNGLNALLDQTFSRIERSLKNFREIPNIQTVQSTVAALKEQHKAVPFNDTDMQSQVEQALEQLGRLGSKNPHPVREVENLKATP